MSRGFIDTDAGRAVEHSMGEIWHAIRGMGEAQAIERGAPAAGMPDWSALSDGQRVAFTQLVSELVVAMHRAAVVVTRAGA